MYPTEGRRPLKITAENSTLQYTQARGRDQQLVEVVGTLCDVGGLIGVHYDDK